MRKTHVQAFLCLSIILLGLIYLDQIFASDCPRRCLVKVFADEQYNKGLNEVVSSFLEAAKTEYFSFVYWDDCEYLLSVEFAAFENGIYRSGWETDEQGRRRIVQKGPFKSHLIFGLWFVAGKPQDKGPGSRGFDHEFNYFVRDWESWSEDTDPISHKSAILSQIQATPPLHEIAWDYERMPETIEMEPEKECVEYDEEVRINMKNSRDRKGRNAQPFFRSGCDNRFVFTTKHGKILLSDENKIGEKEWATSAGYNYCMYQAPSADECGDCKEDTITVYNSCDVLDPDVYPYSQTRKNEKIYEITIDISCDWEGTIKFHWFSRLPKDSPVRSEFDTVESDASRNWTLEVELEIDSMTEQKWTYKLKSATLDFEEKFRFKGTKTDEDTFTQLSQETITNLKKRELHPAECELTLVIDLEKKVYRMEGLIDVEDIAQEGTSTLNVRDKSGFTFNKSEPIDDTTDIVERADFGGSFVDSAAVEIKGRQEEEVPSLPGLAVMGLSVWFDNITGEIEWEFKKGKGDR